MAFALVHFTVGFVLVLAVLSLVPVTRYRLTGAYAGGVWALIPDLHKVVGSAPGRRFEALHWSPLADVFFFHRTLDAAVFRAHNVELTALSMAVLGVSFVMYDRWFAAGDTVQRRVAVDESEDLP